MTSQLRKFSVHLKVAQTKLDSLNFTKNQDTYHSITVGGDYNAISTSTGDLTHRSERACFSKNTVNAEIISARKLTDLNKISNLLDCNVVEDVFSNYVETKGLIGLTRQDHILVLLTLSSNTLQLNNRLFNRTYQKILQLFR